MKTKYILLGLCFAFAFALPAFAQRDTIRSNKNEFSFGYGHMPASSFQFHPGHYYHPETEYLGAFYATYTRRLTKVVGIGATYCFDPRILNYYDYGKPICRIDESSHALMFHLKINWLNTKYVNLYSKVGQGIMAWGYRLKEYQPYLYEINMPSNKLIDRINYAYQFTPIGIEVGTKQYAGFLLVGIGMEGMIGTGVRYGLRDKRMRRKYHE